MYSLLTDATSRLSPSLLQARGFRPHDGRSFFGRRVNEVTFARSFLMAPLFWLPHTVKTRGSQSVIVKEAAAAAVVNLLMDAKVLCVEKSLETSELLWTTFHCHLTEQQK